ncbi:MAG: 50S ribosomal protein L23 [Erysipelotrichaceae bacterium]|nr:50S ribosomal protein L23 [Erysipelotrichaceae bacterium]
MSNAREVIVRPIITEKSMKVESDNRTYVFEVKKGTNKIHVRQAIEEIFNVKVESVNIVNVHPRSKRIGMYTGMTNAVRKAYVKLKDGYTIDLLKDK